MQIDALKVARFYATVKHAGQLYAGLPYTHHLAAVEAVARRFKDGEVDGRRLRPEEQEALVVAAWLHDVVEDCGVKVKEIAEMFGEQIAGLVDAVTKVATGPHGEKLNRRLAGMATYPKTRAGGFLAVRLKLADRIANVENGGSLVEMYRKEHEDFRRALYTPGVNEDMWQHLDGLLACTGCAAGCCECRPGYKDGATDDSRKE